MKYDAGGPNLANTFLINLNAVFYICMELDIPSMSFIKIKIQESLNQDWTSGLLNTLTQRDSHAADFVPGVVLSFKELFLPTTVVGRL